MITLRENSPANAPRIAPAAPSLPPRRIQMRKLLLAPAVALLALSALAGCSSQPAPAPSPIATPSATAVPTGLPTIAAAPTAVPKGKDDGTLVSVDDFAAPVLAAAPDIAKVYTKPEMVKVATDACADLRYGAMESDVVQNVRSAAIAKAAATGVDKSSFTKEVDTLLDSGLRSYCPEFQLGGDPRSAPTIKAGVGPNPSATASAKPTGTPTPAPSPSK